MAASQAIFAAKHYSSDRHFFPLTFEGEGAGQHSGRYPSTFFGQKFFSSGRVSEAWGVLPHISPTCPPSIGALGQLSIFQGKG